jgi:photosystem II stability/assembly factor-like uncharacterized protein
MHLLVGSSKGLIILTRQAGRWGISATQFVGLPVSLVYVDPRDGSWWVGVAHRHWGPKLHRSRDQGQHWEALPVPRFPPEAFFRADQPAQLKKIWCLQAGGPDQPGRMWLGVEPAALFFSDDGGASWQLETQLWQHPSRMDPNQWFGAGRDLPFLHSIVLDPHDSGHLYVAVSCAGIFETRDGAQSWHPRNQGLVAAYLPNPEVEVGHDPHRLLACPAHPSVMWQQNHCGVFRSTDGAKHWQMVSQPDLFVSYGFALAVHEQDPAQAWVIPVQSDEQRVAPNLGLYVAHTRDGGQHWEAQRHGLPQQHAFDIVLRHGLARHQGVMAFGTNAGNLYLSEDDGHRWQCLSQTLPRMDMLAFG